MDKKIQKKEADERKASASEPMDLLIVDQTEEHRKLIIDTMNYYIESSFAAFPVNRVAYAYYDNMQAIPSIYPKVVMYYSGEFAGFAFLRPYEGTETFRRTALLSIFIRPEYTGKGIGSKVLKCLITAVIRQGIDRILSSVSAFNDRSIQFLVKNGFVRCGYFESIGRKFEKDLDVIWMEYQIDKNVVEVK